MGSQASGLFGVSRWNGLLIVGLLLLPAGGCGLLPRSAAQTPPAGGAQDDSPVAVQTAVAKPGTVEGVLEYTGTTRPAQQVSLRSQISGQLVALSVDAGDPVGQGEVLARVDDGLLRVTVNEAQSELASRQSQVAQAEAEVSDARTALESARVQFQQAQTEADRLKRLAEAGAIPDQQAEQAQLALDVARQGLRSAEEQIRTRQQAVNAAKGQVGSQQAVVAQEQEQLSFTAVRSPLTGVVLQKLLQAGDYVQPGTEILQVGNLSQIEVTVQVSELDLSRVSVGQAVEVRLDAFPDQEFAGRVSRIAPLADATSRLLPVEITLNNSNGRIGSGLLSRVRFTPPGSERVVVPLEAVQEAEGSAQVFVLEDSQSEPVAQARSVTLGSRTNAQVEILAGLEPGEVYVVKSDRPLTDAQPVRTSILSETGNE